MNPSKPKRSILLRLILVVGIVFLGLVFLAAVLFAFENWRGHRAWAACKQELEAKGEKLDWNAFVPPAVPDDQNFAATPFFASMRFESGGRGNTGDPWPKDYTDAQKEADRISRKSAARKGAAGERRLIDLVAWQRAFRKVRGDDSPPAARETADDPVAARAAAAREVLEGLKVCDPILDELRTASKRPQSRFPLQYDLPNPAAILLPHLAKIKGAVILLQIRTAAELAAGQGDAALDDVKLMLYLADSIKDEPFLISHLVRIACLQITVNAVWEGLAERKWSGAQLPQLQALFQTPDFLASAQQAMRGERAFGLRCIDYLRRAPRKGMKDMGELGSEAELMGDFMARARVVMPSGWFDYEEANYARMFQELLVPDSDIQGRRLDPSVLGEKQRGMAGQWRVPWKAMLNHRVFGALLLPALGNAYAKFALAQTVTDQAVLACALERYRQSNQQFPDKLEALVPGFLDKLPLDVITGELQSYRRTADGQFLLYSVGWNATDDGGVPGKDGDWVWEYPPK